MTAGDGGAVRVWDTEARDLRAGIARHEGGRVKQVRGREGEAGEKVGG